MFPAYKDEIDAEVQPIFDGTDMATATWRQVRVPLEDFAGQTNLTLRIEFSTSGTTRTTTDSMRIISGSALAEKSNLIFAAENSEGNSEGFALRLADVAVMPSGEQLVDWLATGGRRQQFRLIRLNIVSTVLGLVFLIPSIL